MNINRVHKTAAAKPIRRFHNFDEVLAITASNAEIEAAVADADLPSLLAALAMLTGNEELIQDELRPPTVAMSSTIAPQGGLTEDMQAKARQLATRELIRYRDRACPPAVMPPADRLLNAIFRFLARDAGDDYVPLLKHELALPSDLGKPKWHKDEVASDTHFKVAVIGAGLSGIAAAHRLQQAGVPYVVFEKNSEVGGVWWNNRYPGCRLDTPNFAYSFSFAQKPDWPHQFSRQPVIQEYLAEVAEGTAIRGHMRFETEVLSLSWQEDAAVWRVRVRQRSGQVEEHIFNAVMTAVGQLNRPNIPQIQGQELFKGPVFHSAEWPRDIDLRGRKVAVIGTGASAFQIVPSIVDEVAGMTVFQRNPPWMLPTPTYHEEIKHGMAWLLDHVPYYGRWYRFWQFWIAAEGRLPLVDVDEGWEHPISVGRANERLRQECVAHIESQLSDRPDLLAKATPNYAPGSKRLVRDNGVWLRALKQPHVSLVTERIERMVEDGIVAANGEFHPADVVVFATGFHASEFLCPITITGRHGKDLHRWWGGDSRAYLGITVPGFPNLFMLGGPNTASVINGSAYFASECAAEYTLSAIKLLLGGKHRGMDCREEAFLAHNRHVDAGNLRKAWGSPKVASTWYRNSFGRASVPWPFPLLEYWNLTSLVNMADYEFL